MGIRSSRVGPSDGKDGSGHERGAVRTVSPPPAETRLETS